MRKGRKNAIILGAVALIFGIIAVVLSFVAYANRMKHEDVSVTKEGSCKYKGRAAFVVGIVAALFLLAEQTLISVGTGCFCCGQSSPRCPCTCARITAIILFVLSWLTFIISFVGLILSAAINKDNYYLSSAYPDNSNGDKTEKCYNIGKYSKLFIGAAIWCAISIILGLLSYIIFKTIGSSNHKECDTINNQSVAMGQSLT